MNLLHELFAVVFIGCGATLLMDVWLMFLKRLGVQTLNFAFIGRWVGHGEPRPGGGMQRSTAPPVAA